MPKPTILDTRKLSDFDPGVWVKNTTIFPSRILWHGWVPYCLKHNFGLRVDTRDQAREVRDTTVFCYECQQDERDALEPNNGVDLSTLRYAQSSQCGCPEPWGLIRNNLEASGNYCPRCVGCGAVPEEWYHARNVNVKTNDVTCWCGFVGEIYGSYSTALFEQHVKENKRA